MWYNVPVRSTSSREHTQFWDRCQARAHSEMPRYQKADGGPQSKTTWVWILACSDWEAVKMRGYLSHLQKGWAGLGWAGTSKAFSAGHHLTTLLPLKQKQNQSSCRATCPQEHLPLSVSELLRVLKNVQCATTHCVLNLAWGILVIQISKQIP